MPTYGRMSLFDQWSQANPLGAKPVYEDKYSGQMQDLYKQISGRGPFQYDTAKDPLFQGYKDQYMAAGKLAMKDTMGQAAALTGGYANTYGQQVGQQAYDAYLQKLGDVIPTLYGMAMDNYKMQGDQMLQEYSMLGDMRDRDYGMYRDALGDWENTRNFLVSLQEGDFNREMQENQYNLQRDQFSHQQAQDAWNNNFRQQQFSYQQQQDAADRAWQQQMFAYQQMLDAYQQEQDAYNRAWNEEGRNYNRTQDAYGNLYSLIAGSGYVPSDAELAAAGMSRQAADAIANEYNRNVNMDERTMALREADTYNSGGGGGGGGRSSPGWTYGDGWATAPDGTTYVGPAYGFGSSGDYERLIRETMADDLGYMPTAGQVGWNDTAQMLDTLGIQEQTPYTGGARQKTFEEQTGNKGYTGPKTAGQDWNEIRKKLGI